MTQRKVVPKELKNEILAKVKGGEKVADLAHQYGSSDKIDLDRTYATVILGRQGMAKVVEFAA